MARTESRPNLEYVDLSHLPDGNALLELQREMPEQLASMVSRNTDAGELLMFSFPVDMNLLGEYAQEWLILTNRRCSTWTEEEDGFQLRHEFNLEHLKEVRLRTLTGNHILLVDSGDGWQELVRSSNMTSWKLRPTRQVLEKVIECGAEIFENPSSLELSLPERQVCEKCGRIIRPRIGTCLACLNKRQLLMRMLDLVKPYKLQVGITFLLLISGVLLGMAVPLVGMAIVDDVMVPALGGDTNPDSFWTFLGDPGTFRLLCFLVAIWFILLFLPAAIGGFRQYVGNWVGNRVVVDLSNRLFSHMMRLSLSFYHREETGRVMSRITNDVNRIHRFVSMRLPQAVMNILQLFVILGIMLGLHWELTLWSMAPIPLMVVLSEIARRKIHRIYHVLWRRHAAVSNFLASKLPGIRVVKGFAQGGREVSQFGGIMNRVFEGEMRAAKITATLQPALHMTVQLGHLIIFVVAGYLMVSYGKASGLTVGLILAFTQYMHRFFFPMMELARMLPEFEHAATSADRVFEVLDSEPELDSDERNIDMPPIVGKVDFKHVTFGYDAEEPVLEDVNFTVQPGEMIGLVGHSGAGKTTLINLVCHFFKADEGHVLVDDVDVTKVRVESLRSQIGIVSQEPFLFNGTVAENIAYGRPDATPMEIIAAAKAANAHDFILDFPEGYDTIVGERGARVSGGERQRIAIARAILKNPRILILDEATSSVDTETEEKIQEALRRLVAGRTTFAIAHRLSTLKFADRLFVLKDGKLVEEGTHDELMRMDGVYRGLCDKQQRLSSMTVWQE